MHSGRLALAIAAMAILLLVLVGPPQNALSSADQDGLFRLRPPAFMGAVKAEANSPLAGILDEAGISAYFKASTAIDLANIRPICRTIETDTSDYIICSVPVGQYPESEDAHVYVHKDGWILAYYLAADPAAKIFDWRKYYDTGHLTLSTKLENTVAFAAGAAEVIYTAPTYYDFRYPNATHMTLVADWVGGGTDSFQVMLPTTFVYYERSWSLARTCAVYSYTLDGLEIHKTPGCGSWYTNQGTLTAVQILAGPYHTIAVNLRESCNSCDEHGYAGLALIYRMP